MEGEGGRQGGREGEIPPLITSWVTTPAGRCQNPTLSDVRRELENGKDKVGREREEGEEEREERGRVMRTGSGIRHSGRGKKKEV